MAKGGEPRADAYLAAAVDRSADAVALYESGRFGAAIWVGGVALECLFRGYQRRKTDRLETGHNLHRLSRASGFLESVPPRHQARLAQAIGEVIRCWRHRHRYDSEAAIGDSLERGRDGSIDRAARVVVDAVRLVVQHGVTRWHRNP